MASVSRHSIGDDNGNPSIENGEHLWDLVVALWLRWSGAGRCFAFQGKMLHDSGGGPQGLLRHWRDMRAEMGRHRRRLPCLDANR